MSVELIKYRLNTGNSYTTGILFPITLNLNCCMNIQCLNLTKVP